MSVHSVEHGNCSMGNNVMVYGNRGGGDGKSGDDDKGTANAMAMGMAKELFGTWKPDFISVAAIMTVSNSRVESALHGWEKSQADRQTDWEKDKQTERETNRQTDNPTDRQVDRQIDRQFERQIV